MAIQFARCEYVSRSTGGNACRKASYNQRETVRCERTGEVFSFKERDGNVHHEILLPEGVHERFKNSSVLWNEVEACERRRNSQLAKEFVIALPDDQGVTLEDRIELTRRFCQIFVEKGVAVQLDVHSPHEGEKNWHAHLLVATRRFSEDGLTFSSTKARDLDPVVRGGVVVEADLWGEIWRELQNSYFEEKGYDFRVDPIGIISQEHLGPVRMRHHLNEAILRSQMLQKANEVLSQDPINILEEISRTRAVFSTQDVNLFLQKHVPLSEREGLLEKVLENPQVIPLYDKKTKEKTAYFTTKKVRAEEEKLLRFADTIANKPTFELPALLIEKGVEGKTFSVEQKEAYELCVSSEQNLCILQGRAGVGKSYVLNAIRSAHEASNFRVLGLAPTNKVAMDLKKDGFEAKTCHSFLFSFKNRRETLDSNTVVIVDEAGMLGTTLSVELLNVIKNKGSKLILVGDDRQLSSVERGGTFRFLAERYRAVELKAVRRQTISWQRQVSKDFSNGDVKSAVHILQENKAISWAKTKEEALAALLKAWARDSLLKPQETRQILTQKNVDVDALNQGARDILRSQGKLGDGEIICSTTRGRIAFAEGDRIQFTKTDKRQGLMNASFGVIEKIDPKTKNIIIKLENKEIKVVNPNTYNGLRHGYAATVYKAQGSTLVHVYVLHSKTANLATNYVAHTRQTQSLSLYVSKEETPSKNHLIRQLSRQEGKGTSLEFNTYKDIENHREEKTISAQFKRRANVFFTKVKDLFHKNEEFYKLEEPKASSQDTAVFSTFSHSKGKISDNTVSVLQQLKNSQASSFFPQKVLEKQPAQILHSFMEAKDVNEALKQDIAAFSDHVFASLGEDYNQASSTTTERRYGKKGHISVNLKTGAWIDHRNSEMSGGPLHMLTKLKGFSFKEAIDYGASWAGLQDEGYPLHLSQAKQQKLPSQEPKEEDLEKDKQVRIQKAKALWDKGLPIQGSLAERYLREHRKIEGSLPSDLRYLPHFKVYSQENGKPGDRSEQSYPCLMAAARSPQGEITAVQLTFLNSETASKADLSVTKRSFGVLKGSAVTLQEEPNFNVLFVAEGVETALSLKESGVKGTIKATLGLTNIKRFSPENPFNGNSFNESSLNNNPNTQIIVCADHDLPGSPATRSLQKSVLELQSKGFSVTVVKPDKFNEDFNDVLKTKGPEGVREIMQRNLPNEITKDFLITETSLRRPDPLKNKQEEPRVEVKENTFEAIEKRCTNYLHTYLEKENRSLTLELKERITLQSEKAADLIFHAHSLKGVIPTEEQVRPYLLRAKYELDRIPEIRRDIIKDWQRGDNFNEKTDGLFAHMIAERQASIEGRLYFEAKQKGQKPPSNIEDLATRELKENRTQTKELTERLSQKYGLSESAAILCAKNALRYRETHGDNPTTSQVAHMVEISRELEKKDYAHFTKALDSHEIEFLRRKEGDSLLRSASFEGNLPYGHESGHAQAKAKASLEIATLMITQDLSKINAREFSL